MKVKVWMWKFFMVFGVAALAAPSFLAGNSGVKFATVSIGQYQNVSANWAGYAATGGKYTAVAGTWVVPNVKASSTYRSDAAWVGIGGVTSTDLIQAGTSATTGAGGGTVYSAWIEVLPAFAQNVSMPVSPGDSVSVSIEQQQPGTWLIAMANNTSGRTYQKTLSYKSSLSSAEWIEEMPSDGTGLVALDSFSRVSFSGGSTTKGGVHETIAKSGAQAIAMASAGGKLLAVPSSLSSSGSGFSVSRAPAGGTEAKNARLVRSFTHSRR